MYISWSAFTVYPPDPRVGRCPKGPPARISEGRRAAGLLRLGVARLLGGVAWADGVASRATSRLGEAKGQWDDFLPGRDTQKRSGDSRTDNTRQKKNTRGLCSYLGAISLSMGSSFEGSEVGMASVLEFGPVSE